MPISSAMALRPAVLSLILLTFAIASLVQNSQAGQAGDLPEPLAQAGASEATEGRIRFFEAQVRRDTVDFVAYNQLAAAFLQRARETGDVADYERAEAALQRSITSLPGDNLEAYLLLAAVHVAKHRFAEALGWLEAVDAFGLDEPLVHVIAGDALLGLGRYEEARAAYQRLAGHAGVTALARLAYLAELQGDLEGALALLGRALRYRPGSAENLAWLRVRRGHLQFFAGRVDDAESEYRHALTAFPGYVHAVAGLARVRAGQDDYETAAVLYLRITHQAPLPEYVIALGDVLAALKRDDEARQQFDLVRAIDRLYRANGVDTDLQMALFAADHEPDLAGWHARARALYDRQPTIYAADALAWTLYRSGRPSEALSYAREALRLGTRDPLLLFHAGAIAAAAGHLDESRGYLEAALALNPRFSVRYAPEAQRVLKGLEAATDRGRG